VEGDSHPDKEESVRVDSWAWAVRLFKTRSLAGSACRKEHILVNGSRCKASRQVRIGDEIQVRRGMLTQTVRVKALLSKRIGAKLVTQYLQNLTPAEEYEKFAKVVKQVRINQPVREAGTGRPTKRERRSLDEVMNESTEENEQFEAFVKSFTRRP
jgi:ribosome-associated heat shock protein Hsp15